MVAGEAATGDTDAQGQTHHRCRPAIYETYDPQPHGEHHQV